MESSHGRTDLSKKAKEDLEKVSKKLVNTADKKAKEAEKQKDSTAMKALLVESNAARSRSEEIQKKEITGQEKEIKKIEERIKKIDYYESAYSVLNCVGHLTALLGRGLQCAYCIGC